MLPALRCYPVEFILLLHKKTTRPRSRLAHPVKMTMHRPCVQKQCGLCLVQLSGSSRPATMLYMLLYILMLTFYYVLCGQLMWHPPSHLPFRLLSPHTPKCETCACVKRVCGGCTCSQPAQRLGVVKQEDQLESSS